MGKITKEEADDLSNNLRFNEWRDIMVVGTKNKGRMSEFFNTRYFRLFALLHKYGERHHYDPRLFGTISRGEPGRCIDNSFNTTVRWLTRPGKHNERLTVGYAEGVSTISPSTLHAWNVVNTTRAAKVVDTTWPYELFLPYKEDVWYQGIQFDDEFAEWFIDKYRDDVYRNRKYLSGKIPGGCVLCYEPLIEGVMHEYRMHKDDYAAALEPFLSFMNSAIRINNIRDDINWGNFW